MRQQRPSETGLGLGWRLWFVFCTVLALAMFSGLGWLVYAIIQYLGRH